MESKYAVIAFDVFGTVVDWYGSVKRYLDQLDLGIDTHAFTLDWRAGYRPAMAAVMQKGAWVTIDALHATILAGLLGKYGVRHLDETAFDHLNKVWHRLDPWEDSRAGIAALKRNHVVCTLSNGNMSLLTHLAKHGQLPWDCILSAEIFQKYKPHPDTYLGVSRLLGVAPEETLLVATHADDLDAAQKCGLATAYVERPLEFGPLVTKSTPDPSAYTFYVQSLLELPGLLAQA